MYIEIAIDLWYLVKSGILLYIIYIHQYKPQQLSVLSFYIYIYMYVYTYKLIDKLCKPCNYIHPDIVSQLLITTILRKLHQTFGRPPSLDGWFLGSMLAEWNTWEKPIHMSLPTFIYHLGVLETQNKGRFMILKVFGLLHYSCSWCASQ